MPRGRTTRGGTKHTRHLTRLVTQRGRRIRDQGKPGYQENIRGQGTGVPEYKEDIRPRGQGYQGPRRI